MATRFYLHNANAPYSPATFRGAWDKTSQQVTKLLDASKWPSTTETYAQGSENVSTDEYDVLIYRGVTGKLKAGTIGTGTVDVMLGVDTTSTDANTHFHLHIYVTQGDSDTPRGTLLSDYREAAGVNEWSTDFNTCAKGLNAAQSLSSLAVSDNDRIVVEIGATFRNTGTTTYYASCRYGGAGTTRDLVAGDQGSAGRGYVVFSEDIRTLEDARVSQGPVETLLTETTITSRVSQGAVEALLGETTITGRVSQGPVEVLMQTTSDTQRVSQVVAEMANAGTDALRLSQVMIELLTLSVQESRISQVVAELLTVTLIESRISQVAVETANAGTDTLRLSQVIVEVVGKATTYCGPPSLSPAPMCGKADVLAWMEWTVPLRSEGGGGSGTPDETIVVLGGTDVPNLYEYSYTFTDAQIKAMPTTPLQILPAPGAGTIWSVVQVDIIVSAGNGAYTNIGTACYLELSHLSSDNLVNDSSAGLTQITDLLGYAGVNFGCMQGHFASEADSTGVAFAGYGAMRKVIKDVDADANDAVTLGLAGNSGDLTGGNAANYMKVRVLAMRVAL